jgi:outer membrane protein
VFGTAAFTDAAAACFRAFAKPKTFTFKSGVERDAGRAIGGGGGRGTDCGGAAHAETLREALIQTYNSNPTIMSQRAQIRSLDESVAIARAQGRPQVSGVAGLNQNLVRRGGAPGRNVSLGVDVSYDLFNGGRVRNAVRAADDRVAAGRANLRATEGDIFTEAVAAYMDVIRDRSIVTLNRNQVRVLETNLQATRDRFEVET